MKRLLFVFTLLGLVVISCKKEPEPEPVDTNSGVSGTGTTISPIVGIWDRTLISNSGGNSWSTSPVNMYCEFRSDGTLTINLDGTDYDYHYNLCNDENHYRMKIQDSNSESLVNQNCECDQVNLATYSYDVNAEFTMLEQWGCNTNGDYVEKLQKR